VANPDRTNSLFNSRTADPSGRLCGIACTESAVVRGDNRHQVSTLQPIRPELAGASVGRNHKPPSCGNVWIAIGQKDTCGRSRSGRARFHGDGAAVWPNPLAGRLHHNHWCRPPGIRPLIGFLALAPRFFSCRRIAGWTSGRQGDHQGAQIITLIPCNLSHLASCLIGGEQGARPYRRSAWSNLIVGAIPFVAGACYHHQPARKRSRSTPAAVRHGGPLPRFRCCWEVGQAGWSSSITGLGHDHLSPPAGPNRSSPTDAAINNHAGVEDLAAGGFQHRLGHQQCVGARGG